jgi:ferredoxin-type protein NapH
VFFALMFAIPVLNAYEIYTITGTYYALQVGGLEAADPAAILQTIFASGDFALPLLSALLFPVLLALVLGRVWCGWMCPYHLLSDGAFRLRTLLRTKLLGRDEEETLAVPGALKANLCRYAFLLAGTAAAGAVGIPVLNFVSAPGILSTEAMILVRQHTLSLEFGFIAVILLVELFFVPRFWCRLFCPTGACLSLIRAPFTLRVRAAVRNPKAACCKENDCSPACPMGLAPFREGGDLLCTNCARCIDACASGENRGVLGFTGFSRP